MSDYHGLDIANRRDRINVVFHFTVPDTNNKVGYNHRQAVKEYFESRSETGIVETQVPWDIGTELDQLRSGEKLELVQIVEFDRNASDAEKQQAMDDHWTQLSLKTLDDIQDRLAYWGKNRDVP